MPLSSSIVGTSGEWVAHDLDARWIMAYAAGLDDALECYLDTRREGGIVAHPLFPVAFEWPVFLGVHAFPGSERLEAGERLRGVHATHEIVIHRPIRPGDRLETRATVTAVEARRPGAFQLVRLDTRDAAKQPVSTTWYGTIFRGVAAEGPNRPADDVPAPVAAPLDPSRREPVPIRATAAHVYTECARIWNPIHTDAGGAANAGLPGIILHGTATLALAVSAIVRAEAAGDPTRVRRIAARFGAMVPMPSEIEVRVGPATSAAGGTAHAFAVANASGEAAVRDAFVVLDPP